VLGLVGNKFTLIATDRAVSRSIVVYKDDEDKIISIDGNKLIGAAGPASDRVHFLEYIEKNVVLYGLRSGHLLSTHATAEFTRNELAEAIRKGPFQVNLLIGGYDEADGASLYFLDYLGSMHRVKVGAHGYASYFALSLFDRYYHADCSVEEGIEILQKILHELRIRFLLKIGNVQCKIVDSAGIREISLQRKRRKQRHPKIEFTIQQIPVLVVKALLTDCLLSLLPVLTLHTTAQFIGSCLHIAERSKVVSRSLMNEYSPHSLLADTSIARPRPNLCANFILVQSIFIIVLKRCR